MLRAACRYAALVLDVRERRTSTLRGSPGARRRRSRVDLGRLCISSMISLTKRRKIPGDSTQRHYRGDLNHLRGNVPTGYRQAFLIPLAVQLLVLRAGLHWRFHTHLSLPTSQSMRCARRELGRAVGKLVLRRFESASISVFSVHFSDDSQFLNAARLRARASALTSVTNDACANHDENAQ